MIETREMLLEKADKMNIKVVGMDQVPHIVQGRPLFDLVGVNSEVLDRLKQSEDDLFLADGIMNIAVFPDGRVEGLRTVSEQYKVVQHDEAILRVLESVPEEFGVTSIDIGTSGNGGRCYAKFKTNKSAEIIPGDIIEFRIGMANSADASKLFFLSQEAFRQWCSNGAMAPDSRFTKHKTRKLHKSGLSLDGEIKNFVETLEESQQVLDGWKGYAQKSLKAPDLETVFEALEVGPRVQEELLTTELRGDNTTVQALLDDNNLSAWNLYNSFTQRITDSDSDEAVKIANGTRVSETFERLVAA